MLRERVRKISRLFKYEFMYRADTDFDEIFNDALEAMLRAGEVERFVDRVRVADGKVGARLEIYAVMVRPYFEAYLVAARSAGDVPAEGLPRKDWIKRTLAIGQRLYLAGEIEERESISQPKFENAITALKDHGLLRLSAKGNVEPEPDVGEQLEVFVDSLKKYLE
jgi:glycerol-3-phosphate O-acyltransferase